MGSAKVSLKEIDLSTRVPSFPGVYGGIVIASPKGPVNERVLVTSDSSLLKKFTPSEKVEVGYDNAFFSALAFLEKSDKLWVVRAANAALYAGAVVKKVGSAYPSYSLPVGLSDPQAFAFDSLPDVDGINEVTSVTCTADISGSLSGKYFRIYDKDGSVGVWFSHGGAVVPAGALACTRRIEVATVSVGDASAVVAQKLSAVINTDSQFSGSFLGSVVTVQDLEVGGRSDAVDGNTGFTFVVTAQGVGEISSQDECLLVYGANQGEWANDVVFKLTTYAVNPNYVKEDGAFILDVYKTTNLNTPIESWLCSRKEGHKDGYGNNIFVDDVLEGSEYIRAFSNPAIESTVYPIDVVTPLALDGGDNGVAVSDSHRITAANVLSNTGEVFVTVLMDGDSATPAYQQHLDSIANKRKDCVACLSTPLNVEANSNYINEIIEYRRDTLNLNSSHSALYTPHLKVYDRFNDRSVFVGPDGYAAGAISTSAANYEIWYPSAGSKRGVVNALDVRRRFDIAEMDVLYDAGINPIRFQPSKGIRIWGQKTLLSRPSALDRLNVRCLFLVIEPAIMEALEDFLFELNDVSTRTLAESKVASYMDRIKARKGCYDYRVICNDTNNTPSDIENYKMNLWLFVKPTVSLEEIPFSVIITSTSVSFDVAAQLV